ncbi:MULTISPECIES: threonine aldolase family protein [Rhodomicrobium]|uniref:threonine aldolase family protein n=1 Tax=Rhodomicrobium TaxID=1068 RepID=UPI0014833F34|nr:MULTISPECIES: threonine aldolase family protein [Rhodomicrobium]
MTMQDTRPIRIDLVSDTATRPTPGMRRAMAEAPVGDEQRDEDPSVNALTARVAELLGQEEAIFLPSGTMCNQIALAVHCRPGDEIIAAENAHIVTSEGAGSAVFASSVIRPIHSERGIFSGREVAAFARGAYAKAPRTRVVAVEQTNNRGGGSVWPLETLSEVVTVASELKLVLHMDGARLLNAVVATGISARQYASPFDSVWLDLSKGLGCPVGGVLAGSAAFIREADVWKHRFGGAMRQAGILAAAGLYALDNHVDRLAEDHANARLFGALIGALPGIKLDSPEIETNLVFFDVEGTGKRTPEIAERLLRQGIRIGVEGPTRMRAVTHLDVDEAGIREAAAALAAATAERVSA